MRHDKDRDRTRIFDGNIATMSDEEFRRRCDMTRPTGERKRSATEGRWIGDRNE